MEPYCFVFKVKPDSPDHHKQDTGGKVALVFALFDSQEEAEQQAIKLLTRNHWKVTAETSVSPLLPMQILNFDTLHKDCYQKATRDRISYCIIEHWPNFLRRDQYK